MNFIKRKKTRLINLGSVKIGDCSPISVQSMTNTDTRDFDSTYAQIQSLESAGCDIVRIAIPDFSAVKTIKKLKNLIKIPLVADVHFDHKLAIASIDAGVDGLRINPGNIGNEKNIEDIIHKLKEKKIPVRIGVNSGSLPKKILKKYGLTPEALVESAMSNISIMERHSFYDLKISVKCSSLPLTVQAYRLLSKKVDYPLHLGITEAGTFIKGSIKSAAALAILLEEGIGDTIRVSLTDDPIKEVFVAQEILKTLDLKAGYDIISCPTCGRTEIDLIQIVNEIQDFISSNQALRIKLDQKKIKIAVMGCVVNGPGEAREADIGLAGGKKEAAIFLRGKIVKKVPANSIVREFIDNLTSSF